MKKRLGICFLSTLFVFLSIAHAAVAMKIGDFPNTEAIVVYWQIENGRWEACGPVQRTTLAMDKPQEAVDAVMSSTKDTLGYSIPVFSNGYTKQVHRLNRSLEKGDFDARKCLEDKTYQ